MVIKTTVGLLKIVMVVHRFMWFALMLSHTKFVCDHEPQVFARKVIATNC